jgi:two-component system chemotaxis response regulator CheY
MEVYLSNQKTKTKENKIPLEKIIIAEDSLPNQKILQHLLMKMGYDVIACHNGHLAWTELNKPENKSTVLVISDLMMPEMDGISFLKKVRESTDFAELPFVLVTAVSEKEQIVQAKTLKVNGYILKPVSLQKVQAKLKELFPNKVFPKISA